MSEKINIVIIGAGQAGLATSYYLTQHGHDHVILEQAAVSIPTWRKRWDSFTLVLPNWTVKLPDFPVDETVKDGFFSKGELIDHFEKFIATFEPSIRFNTQVTAVEQNPANNNYLVHTNQGTIEADHVIVAAGTFQKPRIPHWSQQISSDIQQVHSDQYRNPDQLPEGAVLVVGTGQSGCQIAQELYKSGRKVYVSIGSAGRFQRVYRGRDSIYWLDKVGFFDVPFSSLESSHMRFAANPVATGKDGGGDLDLHQFARDGVTLLGKALDAQGDVVLLTSDLKERLTKIDQFVERIKGMIDSYIEEQGIDAPSPNNAPLLRDGYDVEIIEQLDLNAEGITSIVWGTGFHFDYSWIKLPIFDQDGYPIQSRGITNFPGLYFIGLMFLHTRRSGILPGVAADAKYLVEQIVGQ